NLFTTVKADVEKNKSDILDLSNKIASLTLSDERQWTTINNLVTLVNTNIESLKDILLNLGDKVTIVENTVKLISDKLQQHSVSIENLEFLLENTDKKANLIYNQQEYEYAGRFNLEEEQLNEVSLPLFTFHVYVNHDQTESYIDLHFEY